MVIMDIILLLYMSSCNNQYLLQTLPVYQLLYESYFIVLVTGFTLTSSEIKVLSVYLKNLESQRLPEDLGNVLNLLDIL